MIKTISNYYITIPFVSPATSEVCSSYTLKVYVWNGLDTNVPATATYEFTKENIVNSSVDDSINIARVLNDFIDFEPKISTSTGIVDTDNQRWCKVEVYYTTTDPIDDGLAQLSALHLVQKGYGYGNEGINPQTPTDDIYVANREYDVARDSIFTIPVKINGTEITVISYPNNEINYAITPAVSLHSHEIVKLINISLADTTIDRFVEVTYGAETITLFINEEYKHSPIDIYFQNKEGAQQTLTFRKERKDSISITKESFEADRGQPQGGNHQFVDFNVQGKSSFKVNSGFVSESTNEDFKQLLLSERVYCYDGTNIIPLNVMKKSLEYKTRLNDRLVSYEVEFGMSYNEINSI